MGRSSHEESDSESDVSTCSAHSTDEDEVNVRISPKWCSYRDLIQRRGFRLDTCKDVKQFYQRYLEGIVSKDCDISKEYPGYLRACSGKDDNELCKDAGLPESLFRGTRCADGMNVVIKAVHLYSREYDVVRHLSTTPLRDHPMNHCIPVLDFIEVPMDKIVFIVMEEWSPHLAMDPPYTLRYFLGTLRQHLEHITFMHAHNMAHLDVSLRNMLTDNHMRYACIDFELSRRFDGISCPRLRSHRAAEIPPETEGGGWSDPYKIDVWASGMLILRASKLAGFVVPELLSMVAPMLHPDYECRPTAKEALFAFNAMVRAIPEERLDSYNH